MSLEFDERVAGAVKGTVPLKSMAVSEEGVMGNCDRTLKLSVQIAHHPQQ
jgi:hypothetical protein